MSKTKISLCQAEGLASKIISALAPGCERIEVAGSIRRKKETVGDIEIVAIPIVQRNLLGEPTENFPTLLDQILGSLIMDERIKRGQRWGDKFRQFHPAAQPNITVDLFLVTPESWGVQFMIRTGSAEFSRKAVTQQSKGGFLHNDCHIHNGRVWYHGRDVQTPEETDVFKWLNCGWVEPCKRGG